MRNAIINIIKKNRWTPVILSGIGGALLCIYLYGPSILVPTNTSWLYGNGDISQHQIGWDFYRHDDWRMPLGAMHNLAYPEGTSLVYMDSIPLAAIFFKLFNSILPDSFQYFGLWGLLCFVLQGAISALILKKFSSNNLLIFLGSMLVTLLPIFLMRTYAHTALASQWLLLIGALFIFYRNHLKSLPVSVLAWSLLLGVSVAVHPYFVPMNVVLMFIYFAMQYRSFLPIILHGVTSLISFLGVFWLVGGFVTKDVGTATLGMFGADINALINPINFSYFLNPFPTSTGAYEGLGYLGLGTYLLLLLAFAMTIMSSRRYVLKDGLVSYIKTHKRILLSLLIILSSIALAIGPVIYLNGRVLAVINLPDAVATALSIFRSTGRFIWIAGYAIIFIALITFLRLSKKNPNHLGALVVLALLVTIQFVDVTRSSGMKAKTINVKSASKNYKNNFDTIEVRELLAGKKHVAYTTNSLHADNFFELGALVANNKMTINDGYISREPFEAVERETSRSKEELVKKKLNSDTVYITNDAYDLELLQGDAKVKIVQAGKDTWLVALKN